MNDPRIAQYLAAMPYWKECNLTPRVTVASTAAGWALGDGRAISLGKRKRGGQRWELQLKGAGQTRIRAVQMGGQYCVVREFCSKRFTLVFRLPAPYKSGHNGRHA